MKRHIVSTAVALGYAALMNPAAAQGEKPASPELNAYVTSRSNYETVIRSHVLAEEARIGTKCTGQFRMTVRDIVEYEPVSFVPGTAHPTAGAWHFSVTSERCGGEVLLNFVQVAQNGATPRTAAMLPGTTFAGLQLQVDTMPVAVAAATMAYERAVGRGEAAPCVARESGKVRLIDTEFVTQVRSVAELNAKLTKEGWRENWTARVCDRDVVLPLRFTPTPTGTNYAIDGEATQLLPPR